MPRKKTPIEVKRAQRAAAQKRWRAKMLLDPVRAAHFRQQNNANCKKTHARLKATHPELQRERKRLSAIRQRRAIRMEMLAAYGSRCACCGESEEIFLTLDHANRDGNVRRRESGGWHKEILRLRKEGWPKDGYRILCWNCQYGTYRGVCPHQLKKRRKHKSLVDDVSE